MEYIFDTHAHYDADAFDADRLEVLASMPGQGVELILNPGCDLKSSQTAVELAERFPFVYAAVGVHPEECADWDAEHDIPALEALAQNPKVRAIGEIGLDYHWEDNPPKEHQKKVFALQMELAEKLGLPVVVSVIFFVIYYMISLSGEKLAKEGNWEAVYGMWLSTFILTPIAIYLTYKATNDSALLDTDWYAGKFKALKEKLVPQFKKLTKAIKLKRNGKRDCAQ